MAYIGKSPTGTGVRQRYYFTATGGETSLSGTDDNGLTLSYSDGAYVDVLLNGIELVAGTDYNTSTANTIAGLAALAASDVVTVTVYDIFTVADTVSAKNGGTFSGNVVMNADLTVDTDTLYVDSTNDRVGIGTTSPDSLLELEGNVASHVNARIDNLSASGYSTLWLSSNGSNDGLVRGGSSASAFTDQLALLTSGATPVSFFTNNAERMRIDSSGNLLVGTTSAVIVGKIKIESSEWNIGSDVTTTAAAGHIAFYNPNGVVGYISTSGSSTTYSTTSDYRLKENDVDMTGAITRVKQLQPKRFNFIADPDDTTVDGFMAHEVQTVVPEAITGTHNEVDDEGNPVYQGIDQSKLVPLLTGALQEAIAKIEALEARVTALETA